MSRISTTRLLATLAAAALAITACGGGGGAAAPETEGLEGASFTVGSKEFTEQLILGEIAVQALEAAGATAELVSITGSTNVRTALTAGELDMYWEYTGTGWTTHLQREASEAPRDPAELLAAVRTADEANDVTWLDAAPMNNTYAIAVEETRGAELGVTNLTEYAALANSDLPSARMCAASEFINRDDGLPGLAQVYGFDLSNGGLAEVELSFIPPLVAAGQDCTFGEVTATDGAVAANNLRVLEDDKAAFVEYNVAMTLRSDVAAANPALAEVFNPIAALLTDDVMRGLNERADVGGELPDEIAESWLAENGFA
jgi:osmoprotectant transport system substrate-binding protein